MKYRLKLSLFFVAIALISACVSLFLLYFETRAQLLEQIKSQVVSIAATTANLIDRDLLLAMQTKEDEKKPDYAMLKELLRKVQNLNHHQNIFVTYVYLMKPDPQDKNQLIYIADSEFDDNMRHIGDVEPISQQTGLLEKDHLFRRFAPENFLEDQYGRWLSGYAPIKDEEGHYLATVAVDLNADDIRFTLFKMREQLLIALAISSSIALLGASLLSKKATSSLERLCRSVDRMRQGEFSERVEIKDHDEFDLLGIAMNKMARGLQEREKMKLNFAHYVSQHVLERILQSDNPLKLEGERREVTLLFSDIKEFTTLAEKHPPELIVDLLNEYFETMIAIIFKYNGTLDKFLGDGLMVEFGVPLEDPEKERHAILAALAMQKELKKLCLKWQSEGKPTIEIGIGIHSGQAVVGTIGSSLRMEYTAIGDTVNTASAIQATTRKLGVGILVSETTYRAVKEQFPFHNLGDHPLEGRKDHLTLFSLGNT